MTKRKSKYKAIYKECNIIIIKIFTWKNREQRRKNYKKRVRNKSNWTKQWNKNKKYYKN